MSFFAKKNSKFEVGNAKADFPRRHGGWDFSGRVLTEEGVGNYVLCENPMPKRLIHLLSNAALVRNDGDFLQALLEAWVYAFLATTIR